jgi:hypothetical protein
VARKIRILVLLFILLFVAVGTWLDRVYTTNWKAPLLVALYPINADDSSTADAYLKQLSSADFNAIETFFEEERRAYNVPLEQPVRITLTPPLNDKPPALPATHSGLSVVWWSLHLRWWSKFDAPKPPGPTPRIRLYLLYHDPALTPVLNHSTGLEKGLVGVVHLFADRKMNGSNSVIIAHEFLHTLGATDKYSLETNQPLYPSGYAEPNRNPLLPQEYAELMAGRIPLSTTQAATPHSLSQVVVGPATATEIGWQH